MLPTVQFKDDEVVKQVYFGELSTLETELPLGPEYDNYNMELKAKICDRRSACALVDVGTMKVRTSN